jgi:hypothetical protein
MFHPFRNIEVRASGANIENKATNRRGAYNSDRIDAKARIKRAPFFLIFKSPE